MNTKLIASAVIAFSALTGASAFAQSNTSPEAALAIRPDVSVSVTTRAEVQSQNMNPGQNGDYAAAAFKRQQPVAGSMSRAEVRSQAETTARMQMGGRSAI
ncbi:MAG: hypothetical protein V4614_03565 [Pseudomonadota bacterium]